LARPIENERAAEHVGDSHRVENRQRSGWDLQRKHKPVIAVNGRELDKQQTPYIVGRCIDRAEIAAGIFHFPKPWQRHAGKADGIRDGFHINGEWRRGRRGSKLGIDVEIEPIQAIPLITVGHEDRSGAAGLTGDGKAVFQPMLLPGDRCPGARFGLNLFAIPDKPFVGDRDQRRKVSRIDRDWLRLPLRKRESSAVKQQTVRRASGDRSEKRIGLEGGSIGKRRVEIEHMRRNECSRELSQPSRGQQTQEMRSGLHTLPEAWL
jgi:hypothetical protein